MTRLTFAILLLSASANAGTFKIQNGIIDARFFGIGGGAITPPPLFNEFRISDKDTQSLVVKWSVPDVGPSKEYRWWLLTQENAADYGVDWNLLEEALTKPDDSLFFFEAYSEANRPGRTWKGMFTRSDGTYPLLSSLDAIRFDVDWYYYGPYEFRFTVWWRAIGPGRIVPEPSVWSLAILGIPFLWLTSRSHYQRGR